MSIPLRMPDSFKRQRVLAWMISLCFMVMSFCGFNAPALARTLDDGSLPTRILEVTGSQSGLPATQVLLPDWNRISLSQMPGISRSGSIDGKPYQPVLGYDLSRRWNAGMTPDRYLKLGDISQAFQTEVFSLGTISQLTNLDLNQVALSVFTLAADQTLSHLAKVVPGLAQTNVWAIAPVAALLAAKAVGINVSDQTLAEVLAQHPQVGQLRLKEIDLSRFSVTSISNLEAVQLQQFEGWMNSFAKDIPGLGQVPLGAMPNPITEMGNLVMRVDQVYGPAEAQRNNTISGSDVQGFSVPCAETDCAYVELDDLENAGRSARGRLEGKQWISGKYQEVQGGWGILLSVNGGREPTGRLPFGSAFKVVVMEPDEPTDTVDTALFFRFCANALGCTPYFIGPVPFFTYKVNALRFVGDLSDQRAASASQPTGASRESGSNRTGDRNQNKGNPCTFGGSSQPVSAQSVQGIDLNALAEAIASIESAGSGGYQAVGVHTCADGGSHCGRGLGRYQFMSYNPYAVQLIAAKPGGQGFLNRIGQGYQSTEAELFQFFPPADQDRAFMADLANKIQVTQGQIDPTTGQPFTGNRLLERVAQKHFGGDYSRVDSSGSDALGRMSLQDYGRAAVTRYRNGGNGTLTCAPSATLASVNSSGVKSREAAQGKTLGKATGRLITPAPGFPVTSEFGPRSSPCASCSSNHAGIDIGTPIGTPVRAADDGSVLYAGWLSGYGKTLIVEHTNGRMTLYAHLDSMDVSVGTTVQQGQAIARSGQSGLGTGPHLHFEVIEGATPGNWRSGSSINPRQRVQF
ncbi:M23 family metallopeptidase [Alkalinema pantanalense CENA528]|uniref:M23 family metallopeptidase n=1 Tax=Alkalinema pantanalense TaxID=1620705 RepID=UPI003D6F9A8C